MPMRDRINVVAERLYEALLRIPARRKLTQLEPRTAECMSIKSSLLSTLNGVYSVQEQEWIDRIEARRKELSSSREELTITDYGTGNQLLDRTEEEMRRGTQTRKTVSRVYRTTSVPAFWSSVLFRLVREMKPPICLELGSGSGISGCYHAAALKLNGKGTLVTLEGAAALAAVAEKGFQLLNLDNAVVVPGRFQDTLSEVLHQYAPIDYAFIDGHHDGSATQKYFEQIAAASAETALFVFDDISWSKSMKQAWHNILLDEKIRLSFDLGGMGICLLSRRIDTRQHIQIFLR